VDEEFVSYLTESLRKFFRKKAEEIVRAKMKWFYIKEENELRETEKIDEFLQNLDTEIDRLVSLYIEKLKEAALTSAEQIENNPSKVNEITREVEDELSSKMEQLK